MKLSKCLGVISLSLLMLLTSFKDPSQNNYSVLAINKTLIDDGNFSPESYYEKQCAFCHDEQRKIAPPMSEIKKVYFKAYPNKKDFIKKMKAFVLQPNGKNRLIKNSKSLYSVMPKGMFSDPVKIQKVVEYIYDNVKIHIKTKTTSKSNNGDGKATHKIVKVKIELSKGTDLCKVIGAHSVDFDYAQYTLNDAMKEQLKKVIDFLKANPSIKIEIRNHTDSRGTAENNLILSNKRANAIKNYIISHGINLNRVKVKGMGETQLLNHCKDGVTCTKEQHRQNRRTEIIIL